MDSDWKLVISQGADMQIGIADPLNNPATLQPLLPDFLPASENRVKLEEFARCRSGKKIVTTWGRWVHFPRLKRRKRIRE